MESSLWPFARGSSESGKPVQDLIPELTNRNSGAVRSAGSDDHYRPLRTIAPKPLVGVKFPAA
jgi:hypothetical protein